MKKAGEMLDEVSPKNKKEKKQQYGHKRYRNLPKDEKQRLVEYRKKYYKMTAYTSL